MITIIHGDDTSSSRNYYISKRQEAKTPVILDGEKLIISELMQSLEVGSLFNEEKDIFIENFFSTKKENISFKEIVTYIDSENPKTNIYFWENSELSKTELAVFKKIVAKLFKIPQNLFGFLDAVKPGNISSVKLFHELLNETAEELIFFMLVRQFRLLMAVSDTQTQNSIDEIKRLAPWQTSRLRNQAKLFDSKKLVAIYKKLYDIDLAYKSGKLPITLTQAIDFLLVDL